MHTNRLANAVETYANFLISLVLRSADGAFYDGSLIHWPQQVNDSNETNVSESWRESLDKPSEGRLSSKELNELIAYPPLTTESASSTSKINESDAAHDLIEPMANVRLTHDLEKENELENHVLETINNLLAQLQIDLPIDKDFTTKSKDILPLDFQVCLFR